MEAVGIALEVVGIALEVVGIALEVVGIALEVVGFALEAVSVSLKAVSVSLERLLLCNNEVPSWEKLRNIQGSYLNYPQPITGYYGGGYQLNSVKQNGDFTT